MCLPQEGAKGSGGMPESSLPAALESEIWRPETSELMGDMNSTKCTQQMQEQSIFFPGKRSVIVNGRTNQGWDADTCYC